MNSTTSLGVAEADNSSHSPLLVASEFILSLPKLIVSLPVDRKLFIAMIIAYPFAEILRRLYSARPSVKNGIAITFSIFYLVGIFRITQGLETIAISAIGTYTLAGTLKTPAMPWICLAFLMGHILLIHGTRKFSAEMKESDLMAGIQMVLVMKLSSFCWNIHDGCQKQHDLSEVQKQHALKELPNFLEFCGYLLFFPSLFVGPLFDFAEYRDWLYNRQLLPSPGNAAHPVKGSHILKQGNTVALKKVITSFSWLLIFYSLNGRFNKYAVLQRAALPGGFLSRWWDMNMMVFTVRTKGYADWLLIEGSIILCGLGYRGTDPQTGQLQWNRMENVNPRKVETAQSPRDFMNNWNSSVHRWFHNYLYLRIVAKARGHGLYAVFLTFMTSALWHGFNPGYHLSFGLAGLVLMAARDVRKYVRPLVLQSQGNTGRGLKNYYDILGILITQSALNFAYSAGVVLSLKETLLLWSGVYYFVAQIILIWMLLSISPFRQPIIQLLQSHKVKV